jgi:hypothetical protein
MQHATIRGALLSIVVFVTGCGGETRERHTVSGTVTYRGKPVEMGSIRFEAGPEVGDFASVCYASIADGQYETKPDESPTTGKYRVLVMGIDVARINKNVPPGIPWDMPALFPPYQTEIEIPPPDGKLDIEVSSR